ncbi:nucleoside recognition GATE domain-containing membrane protein YjiH [Psychrobacillus psychrotolerans]|uniref:Nucleoside recognition GATE domain-containing membrane protein YjiH n=1 Tax=Psychrobacillus psychrotolerans TaxID=126156 RepID=A0A1I5XIN8_9BACI|nr:YjiH family protein [Psychrobacillus psychrotolerans]SFQ31828.1 nucleoside recognition GATE domain-containing membrane protein YjiH [Psychrobacillus psychrotolerans]
MKKFSLSTWLLFLLPSIAGVILFMIPLPIDEGIQIPIAWFASILSTLLEPVVQWVALVTLLIAAIGSIIFLFRPKEETFINNLFKVTPFWTVTRIVGAVFSILIIWQIGPEAIWSENTGGMLLSPTGLVSFLFTIFLFAGLLLPLLLNFGLLEFFGTMMVKIMRPLFKLPGRSAVDALTSWVGDGTIGVLLTSRQYEEGYYTKKEAAIIGSTFSVVSITFCIVVLDQVGLGNYFIPYYLTVLLCGVVLAFIMPRIYPLAGKEDTHIDGRPLDLEAEKYPENYNAVTHGLENALNTASKNRSIGKFFTDGIKNVIDMYIGVAPVVLAFGTIALMLAEYTSVFTILGKPFEPLLMLFGIPEAAAAAQTMVVGFADMFLPSILGASIESEMTRFFIATMSVTQLIYMSEVGGLLLGSKIPVNIKDLVVIFLLRTLISFPIIAVVAHILF